MQLKSLTAHITAPATPAVIGGLFFQEDELARPRPIAESEVTAALSKSPDCRGAVTFRKDVPETRGQVKLYIPLSTARSLHELIGLTTGTDCAPEGGLSDLFSLLDAVLRTYSREGGHLPLPTCQLEHNDEHPDGGTLRKVQRG